MSTSKTEIVYSRVWNPDNISLAAAQAHFIPGPDHSFPSPGCAFHKFTRSITLE